MNNSSTSRDKHPDWQQPQSSEAYVDSVLSHLREVKVPTGLKDRVQARLDDAQLPRGITVSSHWPGTRLAAAVLVVVLAAVGLATHRPGALRPLEPIPVALRRVPSSGLDRAGAIRLPVRPVEGARLTQGRAALPPGSGRQIIARHSVLPHGVAIPRNLVPRSTRSSNDGEALSHDLTTP